MSVQHNVICYNRLDVIWSVANYNCIAKEHTPWDLPRRIFVCHIILNRVMSYFLRDLIVSIYWNLERRSMC